MHCRSEKQAFALLTDEEKTETKQAFTAILTKLAPTLYTLFLYDSQFIIDSTNTSFPELEYLSTPHPLTSTCFAAVNSFPSLRRLHVSNIQSMDSADFWETLASSAPLLTHLRLSGVGQDPRLHHFLKIFLRISNEESTSSGDSVPPSPLSEEDDEYGDSSALVEAVTGIAVRLPDLRDIYVRPRINTSMDWTSSNRLHHAEMMRGLREVAYNTEGAGVGRLHLLPETGGYGLLEARSHWADVVQGGDGPWSLQADPTRLWSEAGLRLRLRDLSIF